MRTCVVLAAVFAFGTLVAAQTFRGGIQGTVTDQTDAALPSVVVTVTNVGTGLSRSLQTDATGNYFFSELPLGEYTVSASLQGFATQTTKGVHVESSASQRVNLQLKTGGVQETVEVTVQRPLIDTVCVAKP